VKAGPLCVAHCVLYALSSFPFSSRTDPIPTSQVLDSTNSVYIQRARAPQPCPANRHSFARLSLTVFTGAELL